ncbi:MAG TPA: GyrI-like domain-containing protein, partial [Chitinophagales bacterium]|nr:GyrI-like domain-containing protein [Chitinophagales bacterium]
MTPEIKTTSEKKLIGKRITTTIAKNEAPVLWGGFMPRRKEITNALNSDLYSVEVFAVGFFKAFNPNAEFEKWAAVEVSDFETVPDGMETLTIHAGLYAVFIHKGRDSEALKTFGYIFNTWLPASEYVIDDRPHFEVMGEKYKRDNPESEEEVWVPVKLKQDYNIGL